MSRTTSKTKRASLYTLRCPSCACDQLNEAYTCGLEGSLAWRCLRCNVRFIVTNPSCLRLK